MSCFAFGPLLTEGSEILLEIHHSRTGQSNRHQSLHLASVFYTKTERIGNEDKELKNLQWFLRKQSSTRFKPHLRFIRETWMRSRGLWRLKILIIGMIAARFETFILGDFKELRTSDERNRPGCYWRSLKRRERSQHSKSKDESRFAEMWQLCDWFQENWFADNDW